MNETFEHVDFTGAQVGTYLFGARLGRGGFADVYLAEERSLGRKTRTVAVKVSLADLADRATFQQTAEAFRNDLDSLIELSSVAPIVQYFTSEMVDIFVDEAGHVATLSPDSSGGSAGLTPLTAFLIAMEYADGGGLGSDYRREVILRAGDKAYLNHFIDVAIGLRAAHQKGIIHRDIKPQNIFYFRKANRVKLGDFGIARHLDVLSPPGGYVKGSLAYMSPESFDFGGESLPSRDVYALGCTFYELLTGEPAFVLPAADLPGGNDTDLIARYRELHASSPRPHAYTSATALFATIELSELIRRMMCPHPPGRPLLDEIIGQLQAQRRSPKPDLQTTMARSLSRELPSAPTLRSTHNVSPEFRRDHLGESACFVFITMKYRAEEKYKLLFTALDDWFGDAYSIYEVFGRYDFVLRIWSRTLREEVPEFCGFVSRYLLDRDRAGIRVLACDQVHYLRRNARNIVDPLDKAEALIRLNRAQHGSASDAVRWLQQKGLYVRRIARAEGRRIKCFCLVSTPKGSEADREAWTALIVNAVKEKFGAELSEHALSVYRKAYQPLDGVENERSDFVIKYVAPSYDDVIQVPELILEQITGQQFQTTTLLTTKRFFVSSDNVRV